MVDIGAGFGMHAIPLARGGGRVIAVESSASLLDVLSRLAGALPVTAAREDLLPFRACGSLETLGFEARREPGLRGMVRVVTVLR
jgi:16S rRNA A1518/A1519 N6-dimethyltransferase RsmA/KsgA/DIM1 with predicted DNA glycosylase/AP lyase activity